MSDTSDHTDRQVPLGLAPLSSRMWCIALVLVFLGAVSLRMMYLLEIRDVAFFHVPLSDALVYDQRAQGIAAGDWLGPSDFVHAPLYAYALAVVRLAGFDSLWAPRIVQALLGGAACILLMGAARRVVRDVQHGDFIAIGAGLLLAVYPPAIFFDGLIQKTSMVMFLSCLVLWLMMISHQRPDMRLWLSTGLALGALILVRQNALALVPLVGLFAWWSVPHTAVSRRAVSVAAIVVGLALVLSPWALRNTIVIGDVVLTTPNMGQNFAMGNHPNATGTYLPARRGSASGDTEQAVWKREAEQALGRSLTAAEISDFFMDASLSYIRDNPRDWLLLSLKKWQMTWGAYELPDTEDYYLYKEHSHLLRIGDLVLHFGVLCPLAVAGMILTASHWRRLWPLYGWLAINAVAIAVFVVFARYRAPMIPVILLFASAAVVLSADLIHQRQWRKMIAPFACAMVAAVFVNLPVHARRSPEPFSYVNHAVALANQHRYADALAELDKALALAPKHIDAHWTRASVLIDMQRYPQAIEHYEIALAGDPQFGGAHRGIGTALLAMNESERAAEHFRLALQLDDRDATAMNKLALTHAMAGRLSEALQLLIDAAVIAPGDAEVHLNLGNVHVALQQFDAAAEAYQAAIDLEPHSTAAHMNLAGVYEYRQELDAAISSYLFVLEREPTHREAMLRAVNLLVQADRVEQAVELLDRAIETEAQTAEFIPLRDALRNR